MKRASVHQHGGALIGLLVALSATVAVGCVDDPKQFVPDEKPDVVDPDVCLGQSCVPVDPDPPATGNENNTHDHMGDLSETARDPFQILAERQEEGPPDVRSRLHSCQKIQVATLRNILTSLGVNIEDPDSDIPNAGQLYRQGQGALGAANYDGRVGESITWSAAGAAKLFDVWVQAAPEIIANVSTVPQCQVDGVGPEMFNASNECNADAISCITGRPATPEHVALCNSIVQTASDPAKGKNIAVATLLAANHSCE